MQITRQQISPTRVKLTVAADQAALDSLKDLVLQHLGRNVKVPGFREGKAPAHLIEKQLDQSQLQTEFLEHAVNEFYLHAAKEENLRPVAPPEVSVTKFVPFTTLEFTAETEVVGNIKLPNYKQIKIALKPAAVSADEIKTILDNLRQRAATKATVSRPAKNGDEVTIDFTGTDPTSKAPVEGTDGQDYPLVLGSQSFIPGFEEKLVGLKAGDSKTFTITFPKDYGVKAMQGSQVTFDVTVKEVKELKLPKLDDEFAATVGPFKIMAELKADIKKQLQAEKQQEAQRDFDNELLEKIAAKTEVVLPTALIEQEIDRIEEEEKRNILYRGQTWQEHLDAEGVTAEEHRERQRPGAELRVKAGLILGEIAEQEGITVTPEELEVRIMLLKNQYTDETMQTELDKPENRRDIQSRMMTEKTLDLLRSQATKS